MFEFICFVNLSIPSNSGKDSWKSAVCLFAPRCPLLLQLVLHSLLCFLCRGEYLSKSFLDCISAAGIFYNHLSGAIKISCKLSLDFQFWVVHGYLERWTIQKGLKLIWQILICIIKMTDRTDVSLMDLPRFKSPGLGPLFRKRLGTSKLKNRDPIGTQLVMK